MEWEQQEIVRLLKNTPGTQYQEADDVNKAIIRDWVRSLLQKDTVTVTFIKADGTEREMRCTLNPEKLPPAPVATGSVDGIVRESKERKKPDEHSLRVFDTDLQQWRSFRFDRLKRVTASLEFN
jgi:hypothetical protein